MELSDAMCGNMIRCCLLVNFWRNANLWPQHTSAIVFNLIMPTIALIKSRLDKPTRRNLLQIFMWSPNLHRPHYPSLFLHIHRFFRVLALLFYFFAQKVYIHFFILFLLLTHFFIPLNMVYFCAFHIKLLKLKETAFNFYIE